MWTNAWADLSWFLFDALPLGFARVYDLAKQWQTLIAGLLAILAARILVRGMTGVPRAPASSMFRSAPVARAEGSQRDDASGRTIRASTPRRDVVLVGEPSVARTSLLLDHLRSAVRSAISALASGTTSDSRTLALCEHAASFVFADTKVLVENDVATAALLKKLNAELSSLRTALDAAHRDENSIKETLVRINAGAREIRQRLVAERIPKRG